MINKSFRFWDFKKIIFIIIFIGLIIIFFLPADNYNEKDFISKQITVEEINSHVDAEMVWQRVFKDTDDFWYSVHVSNFIYDAKKEIEINDKLKITFIPKKNNLLVEVIKNDKILLSKEEAISAAKVWPIMYYVSIVFFFFICFIVFIILLISDYKIWKRYNLSRKYEMNNK